MTIAALTTIVCAQTLFAQDSQYWTQRYGTSSRLLGGVVIGSVKDLSAGYYNPGALALVDGAKFILSAKVFQTQILTLRDAGPQGQTLHTWAINPAPSFFAGMLTFDEKKRDQFGYIYLARQQFEARIDNQGIVDHDVLPSEPGLETLTADLLFDTNLNEYWYGLMWGRTAREQLGVGGTLFVAYRGQRLLRQFIGQTLDQAGNVAQSTMIRSFDYYNWRTLAKFGVTYDSKPWTFGLSLTTPSVNLFGRGTSFVDIVVSNLDADGDGTVDDYYATDLQKDRKSQFTTSWAIGMGGSYKRGKTEYTLAVEWFAPIDQFQLIETTSFQAQSTGETLPNQVVAEYKSIANVGFGVQHRFGPRLAIYGSATTDFTAVVPEKTNSVVSTWNLYHLTVGGEFSIRKIHFTGGLEWGFGSELLESANLSSLTGGAALRDAGEADARYDRFTFILGIQFGGGGG